MVFEVIVPIGTLKPNKLVRSASWQWNIMEGIIKLSPNWFFPREWARQQTEPNQSIYCCGWWPNIFVNWQYSLLNCNKGWACLIKSLEGLYYWANHKNITIRKQNVTQCPSSLHICTSFHSLDGSYLLKGSTIFFFGFLCCCIYGRSVFPLSELPSIESEGLRFFRIVVVNFRFPPLVLLSGTVVVCRPIVVVMVASRNLSFELFVGFFFYFFSFFLSLVRWWLVDCGIAIISRGSLHLNGHMESCDILNIWGDDVSLFKFICRILCTITFRHQIRYRERRMDGWDGCCVGWWWVKEQPSMCLCNNLMTWIMMLLSCCKFNEVSSSSSVLLLLHLLVCILFNTSNSLYNDCGECWLIEGGGWHATIKR